MKLLAHLESRFHPDIRGQDGVERASERRRGPFFRHPRSRGLTASVNSGVGSSRAEHGDVRLAQSEQRVLDNALYGSFIRLPLPPREARSVVLQYKLHAA